MAAEREGKRVGGSACSDNGVRLDEGGVDKPPSCPAFRQDNDNAGLKVDCDSVLADQRSGALDDVNELAIAGKACCEFTWLDLPEPLF